MLGLTAATKENLPDLGLLFLRVTVGLFLLFGHGWGKLANFGEVATHFSDPLGLGSSLSLGLAVFAEVFCALAFAVGFFTRYATIPLIIFMLVAALIIHIHDPWQRQEFAMLYLIPFVTILLTGPGKYSVDEALLKRKGM